MQELLQHVEQIKARKDEEIYEQLIWHIAQSMMLVQEIDLAPTEVYKPKNEYENVEKMQTLLQSYKTWLFSFAGTMDAILKTIEYARARTLINAVTEIDVYLENEKIDTITCKTVIAQKGLVFDMEMRGILYDVPDEYLDKNDSVVFKDTKNGNTLPEAFVSVLSRDDEKYNELMFMKSLEEPIDEDVYSPNAIGFLATKENLEDKAFIEYIKELMRQFPKVEFKGFYFNKQQKSFLKTICPENVTVVVVSSIVALSRSITIYVHNGENVEKADILIKLIGLKPFIYFNKDDYEMSLQQNEEKYANEILQAYEVNIFKESFYQDYIGFGKLISAKTIRKEYSYIYIDSVLNSEKIRNKIIQMKV
jgi:hypothetical protein